MHEVSDILVARAQLLDGIRRPVVTSFAVHGVVLALLLVLPAAWFAGKAPEKTITINLGSGALGPDRAGMTATSARKVDVVEPPKPREPVLPTAPPKAAEFVPAAPPKPVPDKPAEKTSASFVTPKPNVGQQIQKGTAVVETGAKGLAAGLSAGGIGGVQSDADFCCKDYLNEVTGAIASRWTENQGLDGSVVVDFAIEKDGRITDVEVKTENGLPQLVLAAKRAVQTARVPPLPERYPGQRLYITLLFPYKR